MVKEAAAPRPLPARGGPATDRTRPEVAQKQREKRMRISPGTTRTCRTYYGNQDQVARSFHRKRPAAGAPQAEPSLECLVGARPGRRYEAAQPCSQRDAATIAACRPSVGMSSRDTIVFPVRGERRTSPGGVSRQSDGDLAGQPRRPAARRLDRQALSRGRIRRDPTRDVTRFPRRFSTCRRSPRPNRTRPGRTAIRSGARRSQRESPVPANGSPLFPGNLKLPCPGAH